MVLQMICIILGQIHHTHFRDKNKTFVLISIIESTQLWQRKTTGI